MNKLNDNDEIIYYLESDEYQRTVTLTVISPKPMEGEDYLTILESFMEDSSKKPHELFKYCHSMNSVCH